MSWGRVVVLDSELSAEIPKLRIVELFPIVRQEGSRDPKSTYYKAPDEVAYLLLCDRCQGLGFDPFGKIVHGHNDKFALAPSNG